MTCPHGAAAVRPLRLGERELDRPLGRLRGGQVGVRLRVALGGHAVQRRPQGGAVHAYGCQQAGGYAVGTSRQRPEHVARSDVPAAGVLGLGPGDRKDVLRGLGELLERHHGGSS
jgi:hypothetical protein